MDGHRDSPDLDIIHRSGCTRDSSLRHDHYGIQRRTVEDLFAAPHAENWIYEGESKTFRAIKFSVEGKNGLYCHSCKGCEHAHVMCNDTFRRAAMQILTNVVTHE